MNIDERIKELERLKKVTFSHFENMWVENEMRIQMRGQVRDLFTSLFNYEQEGLIEKMDSNVGKRILSILMFPKIEAWETFVFKWPLPQVSRLNQNATVCYQNTIPRPSTTWPLSGRFQMSKRVGSTLNRPPTSQASTKIEPSNYSFTSDSHQLSRQEESKSSRSWIRPMSHKPMLKSNQSQN